MEPLLLPLLPLVVVPLGLMIVSVVRGPRRRVAIPSLRIPPAEETAASVHRFQEAAERFVMMDMVWERLSKGRGLLLDDMRAAAARRGRRKRAATIPARF